MVDCKDYLKDLKNWLCESMQMMQHLWLSERESVVSHVKKPSSERMEDVSLGIHIQCSKPLLWEITREHGRELSAMDRHELHCC